MITTDQACTVALKTNDNGAINNILVNGTDISTQTLGLTIIGEPQFTTVTIRLAPKDVDLPAFTARVLADDTTVTFLKQLGWTPPGEKAAPEPEDHGTVVLEVGKQPGEPSTQEG